MLEAYLQNLHKIRVITPIIEIAAHNLDILMMMAFVLISDDKLMLHFLVILRMNGVSSRPFFFEEIYYLKWSVGSEI